MPPKSKVNKKPAAATQAESPKAPAAAAAPAKEYKVRRDLDIHMLIPVKNGFQGRLVYRSKKTGEVYVWERFGDEQDLTVNELKSVRSGSRAFFEQNWFLIDDPEVLEYLGVTGFYKYALTSENFDSLFSLPPGEIMQRVAKLSDGQKRSVVYRAKVLIGEGAIDSLKVIDALEGALGIELIER